MASVPLADRECRERGQRIKDILEVACIFSHAQSCELDEHLERESRREQQLKDVPEAVWPVVKVLRAVRVTPGRRFLGNEQATGEDEDSERVVGRSPLRQATPIVRRLLVFRDITG